MIHYAYGCIGQRNMHSSAKSIDPFDTTPFRVQTAWVMKFCPSLQAQTFKIIEFLFLSVSHFVLCKRMVPMATES